MSNFLDIDPFELSVNDKKSWFLKKINTLNNHHYKNCKPYKKIIDSKKEMVLNANGIDLAPFLTIPLFKKTELKSIKDSKIQKILKSSGTTGEKKSQIYLDLETSRNQSISLVRILQSFIGKKRRPLLIIDIPAILNDRKHLSARGAGIIGLKSFATEVTYGLDDNYNLNFKIIEDFLKKNKKSKFLIFGFTYQIWKY